MPALANLVRVQSATTGTGTLTLGAAVTGFLTPTQAGMVNGLTYYYAIEADYVIVGDDSVPVSRECGYGSYDSGAGTLTRNVLNSTNSNALLNLAGDEQVIVTHLTIGGTALLAQGSVSGVATLDIVLTAYTRFKAIDIYLYYFIPVTSTAQLLMRVSTDGGSSFLSSATYWHASTLASMGGGLTEQGGSTATSFLLNPDLHNAGGGNGGAFMRVTLWDQTKSWWTGVDWAGGGYKAGGDFRAITGSGIVFSTTQDTDAVRFLMSSGNIDLGDYRVYGRN